MTCNPNLRDGAAVWNVEDNRYPRCKFDSITYEFKIKKKKTYFTRIKFCFSMTVPNVSFSAYKLNFFQRFVEAHAVMLSGNAGLKPKDGEMTSRPWMWPINLRVS